MTRKTTAVPEEEAPIEKKPASKKAPTQRAKGKKSATGEESALKKKAAPKRGTTKKATEKAASPRKSPTAKASPSRETGSYSTLVVVESPSKAKTIGKYLGKGFKVIASKGHVKDLPKSKLGIDIEHGFEPDYQILKEKKSTVDELKDYAKRVSHIYLATDPDREGEAISYHLYQELAKINDAIKRVWLREITERGVKEAFDKPLDIDEDKVNAQTTRRVLDRLVGYQISPLLWTKVKYGLSAGRVQSVALRLICEREREIRQFKSEEYWSFRSLLAREKGGEESFWTKLEEILPEKAKELSEGFEVPLLGKKSKLWIPDKARADRIEKELRTLPHAVERVEAKEKKRDPGPPLITSTLQQNAHSLFGFPVRKTMQIAQKLYEGINLGERGPMGLITYMRTDSLRISPTAIEETRRYVEETFGKAYLSDKVRVYKNKSQAQDAHEAIRPTDVSLSPERVRSFLTPDEAKLYSLIWDRFTATQMASLRVEETEVVVAAGPYRLATKGERILFDGFTKVLGHSKETLLPELKSGDPLKLLELEPKQNFTQPPARYTEGTLVKALEDKNIGRPSTYGTIIATLQNRDYVNKEAGHFIPSDLGMVIEELLEKHFPRLMDVTFTAQMEEELDRIEEGKLLFRTALENFYLPFSQELEKAKGELKDIRKEGMESEKICPKCSSPMLFKSGRFGEYYLCSKAECGHKENAKEPPTPTDEKCPQCGEPLVWRKGRFGRFLACSGYPTCRYIKSDSEKTNFPCPNKDGGVLVKRKAKKRRSFFHGCSLYPKCNFLTNDTPVERPCPSCSFTYLLKGKGKTYCPVCNYEEKDGK